MDTELYIHPKVTNNNSSKKKWSTSSNPALERLEENVETSGDRVEANNDSNEGGGGLSSGGGVIGVGNSVGCVNTGRRKSWHVGKLDYRRRRKGVSTSETTPKYDRQKRHSWWNVFLPEHFNRSRRSSTDVTVNRNVDRIPFVRSKSRSVDHGFSTPFDLDSLRSKVEGRFESVDRLSKDGDTELGSKESLSDRKMQGRTKTPPPKTSIYKVEANDTLTSIAAHFDTTPSELAILNRLPSRTVFPGQVIRVPDKKPSADAAGDEQKHGSELEIEKQSEDCRSTAGDEKTSVTDEETEILDKLRVASPKPGHVECVHTPTSSPTAGGKQTNRALERFLKINVRHITDGQGVVAGVLLVTPNAVMFDPNVSDPLVIDQGPESYGVIAPMEYVVNAAIYHDIAHMRVGHADQIRPDVPKPEVYHMKCSDNLYHSLDEGDELEGVHGDGSNLLATNQGDSLDSGDPHHSPSAREDSLLAKDETFPELRSSTEDEEEDDAHSGSGCSCSGIQRDGAAFPKAFERDLVTPTNLSMTGDKLPESVDEEQRPGIDDMDYARSLEERRKSSLDHHWAVPNKPRSLEENFSHPQEDVSGEVSATDDANRRGSEGMLLKLSCHDSGIDIRDIKDPIPTMPRKTTYSDADILLGGPGDFVPPVPIQPLIPNDSDDNAQRKKHSSVSFSLEEDQQPTMREKTSSAGDADRQETKKNKMIKRLSYPLSWMEGIVGEKDERDGSSGSLPASAESHSSSHPTSSSSSHSHSSVFSKVFSSLNHSSCIKIDDDCDTDKPQQKNSKYNLKAFKRWHKNMRSSVGTFIRQQQTPSNPKSAPPGPKLDYRSMVSVDDMPELFVSFDIHAPLFPQLDGLELIPRPARSCEDPPLYLRLRMGKPINKKIPKSTPVMSYGKKKMRPEYWFSVPRERVDDLYRFLMLWVPHLYGDLVEETVRERGYELVDSDTELWENEEGNGKGGSDERQGSDDEVGDLTRESWEVIKAPYAKLYTILKSQTQLGSTDSEPVDEVLSMSEELRRALYSSSAASLDQDFCLPDLVGVTEILTEEHRKQLCRHLPARAEGYLWTLVFSTSQHGFSLNSMYRKMNRIESPILLVIQDTEGNVFGGLTSCALKVSDHFYGTGESLLYRFSPEFQVYNWTGENMYFIKGNNESLSIGAGDGKFGLWLDGDLNQGRTEPCDTYGNDPLTPQKDFVVKILECWAFV
ncbi:TLD domain-containing protein mustard isoform X1 [Lycorma delicatula]|uniref:TLD domain-containing protein mustard isoform X1 n=2 Tax=Lycorma delicatula TaxID=130591 RepID=UPI003F510AE1